MRSGCDIVIFAGAAAAGVCEVSLRCLKWAFICSRVRSISVPWGSSLSVGVALETDGVQRDLILAGGPGASSPRWRRGRRG
ncbi:hypothetical protein ACOMHN_019469 [Nucella lapillus]